ncbi:MAG: FTR1 family iron permease [Planctomycetota bacterium]|jgi:high-affinity iron transporter|nr:FTR1 family iron permease [Planctomycetota bacterium]
MKQFPAIGVCVLALALLASAPAAAGQKYSSWSEIAAAMRQRLDEAGDAYAGGDAAAGKGKVNDAYFGYYEKLGFERAVLSYVSGRRASEVEYKFSEIKKLMTNGAPLAAVRAELQLLGRMLREDAGKLDGKDDSPWATFIASLVILLREGFEAILVIAAISAYLVRSGNRDRLALVYWSSAAAILASVVMALALQYVFEISGANQEILEGAAMLTAVVVLFFVSNWMINKAETEAWKNYLDGKVRSAVAGGSAFALGFAAFLAVFREGAETILFYQALLADTDENRGMLWAGLAVAAVLLAVIFVLFRYGSLVVPIKPFFIGTSLLLFVMSISFAGGGIKEFQEADLIGVTPVGGIEAVDILGIYPTVETLAPQALLLLLAVLSVWLAARRAGKIRKSAGEAPAA